MEDSVLNMELDETDDVEDATDQDTFSQTADPGFEVNADSDHSESDDSPLEEAALLDEEHEPAINQDAEAHCVAPERGGTPNLSLEESDTANPTVTDQPMAYMDPPRGMKCADGDGNLQIDALAGRSSVFGLGAFGSGAVGRSDENGENIDSDKLLDVIVNTNGYSSASSSSDLADLINQMISPDAVFTAGRVDVHSDVDLARESAFIIARTRGSGKRFKTIVVAGSDHGNTLAGLTASSRSFQRNQCGPLIAGFAHVAADIESIRKAIDDQTGAVLFSPCGSDGAVGEIEESFLSSLRSTCDENDLLLIADESDLVFGSTGSVLSTTSISNIDIDLSILSAGLFGGLPGGWMVCSRRFVESFNEEIAESTFAPNPINQWVSRSFLTRIRDEQVLVSAEQRTSDVARRIAQSIAGFDFVRDISRLGSSVSMETDIESTVLVRNAARVGLRVEPAGPTGVQMRLPILVDADDLDLLVTRLAQSLEFTEYQTAQALNH